MASAGEKRKANESLEILLAEKRECPVCLKSIKDPPVFLCTNGHELCHKCRELLKAEQKPCPVCKGELLDVRNRAVEKLLKELPKTECKHDGCTFARSDTQLVKSHEEKECRLKPLKCEACPQPIALSQLYNHLLTIHEKTPLQINLGEDDMVIDDVWSDDYWKRLKITPTGLGNTQKPLDAVDNDFKFFINFKSYDTTLTMFWISMCGTQMEAADYTYKLKIKNSTEKQAKEMYIFSGKRDCVSCDVYHEDMKEKKDALFINKALLERVAVENDGQYLKFSYTLKIVKK